MSVSIISDVDVVPVDTRSLAEEIRSARSQTPAKTSAATTSTTGTSTTNTGDRRFVGKSLEDVTAMYTNLEKHAGRLANELGMTQRAVQELIIDKRARDLKQNGEADPVTVDPAELIQRPTEALSPFIEERVSRALSPLQQQMNRIEQALGASNFNNTHADAREVMDSPEFQAWVRETPLRRSIGQAAANGNTQAATDLLTEFKTVQKQKVTTATNEEGDRLHHASSVTLEQSRTGSDGTVSAKPGKTYTRSQMRQLMQSPAYENDDTLREEVQRAYIERRVIGD